MTSEGRLWQIVLVVVGLITAFVPAYVSYDLYGRGTAPEKKIELNKLPTIDPLKDLSALGDKVSLTIRAQNQTIDNIVIVKAWLRNVGRTPILPSDYHESVSVNVKKPWKIIAVENGDLFRGVEFKWKRISDIRFEATPALLNPDDLVSTNIYLSNTEFDKTTSIGEEGPGVRS